MPYVIRLIALEGPGDDYAKAMVGQYVLYYDPARRILVCSPDRSGARLFDDLMDAREYWRQADGYRADGLPNRPLTAYTAEFISTSRRPAQSEAPAC